MAVVSHASSSELTCSLGASVFLRQSRPPPPTTEAKKYTADTSLHLHHPLSRDSPSRWACRDRGEMYVGGARRKRSEAGPAKLLAPRSRAPPRPRAPARPRASPRPAVFGRDSARAPKGALVFVLRHPRLPPHMHTRSYWSQL